MMKRHINMNIKHMLILTVITAATSLMSGCGEGAKVSKTEGDAAQTTFKMPLNDTGVTYLIDDKVAPVQYTAKELTQLKVDTISRTAIFPAAGTNASFETPYKITIQPDSIIEGVNNEPLDFSSPVIDTSQQDASNGSDRDNIFNFQDGKAGFKFEKLDRISGAPLFDDVQEFGCVRDKVTGLIWENKTPAKDLSFPLHNSSAQYSWYNPDDNTNGGDPGQQNGGLCSKTVISGDTLGFINAVNESKLCGFNDWRLPSIEEARSLVDYEKPEAADMVDTKFFPQIARKEHRWTSQTHPLDSTRAYGFHFYQGVAQPHEKACIPGDGINGNKGNVGSFLNGIVLVRSANQF